MENSLRQLRIIWGALLISIFLYAFVAERVPHTEKAVNAAFVEGITLISVLMVVSIFMVRRLVITSANQKLASQPDDSNALVRWRFGSILALAGCESVALFGFVLRFSGCTLAQAGIFYLAALILIVFLMPRRPEQVLGE